MKRAYIFHGWDGSSEEPMHKWFKEKLEEKGYEVIVPNMPDTENPKIDLWVGKAKEVVKDLGSEDIFIGHSVGCQTILRYFETLENDIKVSKVVLIAPWMHLDQKSIEEEGEEAVAIAKPWEETPINFDKVKTHCDNFYTVFSSNDPYVPLTEKDLFEEKLGAKSLVLENRGHFDPDSGIKEVPEILDLLK